MTRSRFPATLIALAASLALAGCGGSSTSSTSAAGPTHLIYSLNDNLYSVPLFGAPPLALADTADPEYFLQLDGDRLLFRVYASGAYDLYSVKLDGTGRTALASGPSDEFLIGLVDGHAIIQRNAGAALVPPVPPEVLSVPVGGGTAVSLAKAADASGRTSASVIDGKIFLSTGTDVSTVRADGTGRVLLFNQAGSVTDVAGSRVALENGSYRVFTVGLDGTGLQDTGHNAVSMSASAYSYTTSVGAHFVGDRAIFSESKADTATTTTSTLFSVPASGLGAEPLGSSTTGIFLPVIDAIGSKFVSIFYTGGRFSVALNDALTPGTVDLDRGGSATYYMGHTTDRVLLVRWSGANQYDLFAANLDGSSVATLGATVESSLGEIAATAAPVGDRVLYRTSASGSAELWSVKPDGTSPIQLTRGSGDKFAAALHGTTVVYRRVTSGQGDLYAVEIDGTNHRTLVESVLDERYGLLAGETVVYSQVSGADSNLWAVPLAGGTSVQLTSGAGVRYVSAAY